ncbi:MAG: hypothetical protein J6X07_08930 [Prevotella sp.]|nr:hypothetical protein [Prevotella sp.]
MAKVDFQILENNKMKPHSFYGKTVNKSTLTFDDMVEKACEGTSIEPEIMQGAVSRYMRKVKELLLMGYRVPLGKNFLFVYPCIDLSVKDQVDKDGNVIKAVTIDDVNAQAAKGRVAASVSPVFSKKFDTEVQWRRVGKDGKPVVGGDNEEEEDATQVDPAGDGTGGNSGAQGAGSEGNGAGSGSGEGSGSGDNGGGNGGNDLEG